MISFFGNTAQSHVASGDSPNATVGTKVIIVAGQSNAGGEQNSGADLPGYLSGDLNGFYRRYHYNQITNSEPFAIVNDTGATTIGPDVNLGYLYQQYHNEDIYIIKHAYGGTALSELYLPNWNTATTASLFDGLKDSITTGFQALVDAGKNPSIRGFVWFQGEEDATQYETVDGYKTNEQNFFSALKTDLALPDLKIYSVRIKPNGNSYRDYFDNIRAAKEANAGIIPNYTLINVDDLPVNPVGGLHLTTASQIELGRRIFELLKFN